MYIVQCTGCPRELTTLKTNRLTILLAFLIIKHIGAKIFNEKRHESDEYMKEISCKYLDSKANSEQKRKPFGT